MAIGSGVLLPGVAENPTFPILSALAYTTGLGYRPTCEFLPCRLVELLDCFTTRPELSTLGFSWGTTSSCELAEVSGSRGSAPRAAGLAAFSFPLSAGRERPL